MSGSPEETAPPGPRRPRLGPARARVRKAVREALEGVAAAGDGLVLVALSGGPDSLALASATAFEARRLGLAAGAVVVDHGMQEGSEAVAAHAASQARALGLAPVIVRRVSIDPADPAGPEGAARVARYTAIREVVAQTGARAILLGHTLDDQAETVLLGLARGSGPRSLSGMPAASGPYLRPLLDVPRADTVAACAEEALEPWIDPMNDDPAYTRVRVRRSVLPMLEAELGPGVAASLARTADILREDAEVLDEWAQREFRALVDGGIPDDGPFEIPVDALAALPTAIRLRVLHSVASSLGALAHVRGATNVRGATRTHILELDRLITDYRGQGPLDLPGIRVGRAAGALQFFVPPRPAR